MKKKVNFISVIAFVGLLLKAGLTWANRLEVPSHLNREILSEAVPSALALDGISAADYSLEWEEKPAPVESGIIETDSIQWVRVMDVLVLPRGRVRILFKGPVTAKANYAGYSTGGQQIKSIEFPIALLSYPENKVLLEIEDNGKIYKTHIRVAFKPKDMSGASPIFIDSSCSKYGMSASFKEIPKAVNEWVYIGCRPIITASNDYRKSTLEAYVFWDNPEAPRSILINNLELEPTLPSMWTLRLNSSPGAITLSRASGQQLQLNYFLSERNSLGSLGLGIGPYLGEFNGEGAYDVGWSPLLTLYGSLYISEGLRIVGFDATSISNRLWTDFGLYLSTENAKMLDQRMTMNLLFGGHVVGFHADGQVHVVPSFPQGFEFIYADAFKRGYNMSLGGFFYPEINGRSYYNIWWRWGGKIFGEINYLAAKETFNKESVASKSIGLTFGFPIMKFW